ncbi:MAG: VCBS repeat-containing protein [Planctomycetes bacterium]|nr:VCBS repeat-containing protein [Planctomycetota bacterium]
MFKNLIPLCLVAASSALAEDTSMNPEFTAPVRLKAAREIIRVEDPGYASPCWADMDGDGRKDLVVGQFAGGKMKVYRNLGEGKLAEGKWLEAEGKTAEVPGVW